MQIGKENYDEFLNKLLETISKYMRDKDLVGTLDRDRLLITFYNVNYQTISRKFRQLEQDLTVFSYKNQSLSLKLQSEHTEVHHSRTTVKDILKTLRSKYQVKYGE
jgi:hypothetical protein